MRYYEIITEVVPKIIVEALELDTNLPMDTASRMERAKKLGFVVPAYHGTGADFHEFSLDKGKANRGGGHAPMFSTVPQEAGGYASEKENGNVIPVLLRVKKPFKVGIDIKLSPKQFIKLTGGLKSHYMTDTRDVMDTLYKHGTNSGLDNRKAWENVYAHFKKLGFDCLWFDDVPRDHWSDENEPAYYNKIVVFDTKNIRSIFARFDPEKSESSNILD
jgi:hypothetical protein